MDLLNIKKAGELIIALSNAGIRFDWKECIRITRELEPVFEALQIDKETNGKPGPILCIICSEHMAESSLRDMARQWTFVEGKGYHCPLCSERYL